MKRQMFLATAFSAALAVGVAAQTPPQTPPATGERSQAQQVTVTGCLAQASPATGTTGTAGTATTGSEFILKNATLGSSPSSTTGTSGATSSAMGKSYKLVGGSPSDFKENVNAKVEIRGTIEKPSVTGTTPPATPPATGAATDKDLQTLRVTSVKKIADSCQ